MDVYVGVGTGVQVPMATGQLPPVEPPTLTLKYESAWLPGPESPQRLPAAIHEMPVVVPVTPRGPPCKLVTPPAGLLVWEAQPLANT